MALRIALRDNLSDFESLLQNCKITKTCAAIKAF